MGGVLFLSAEDLCGPCAGDLDCGPEHLCLGESCVACDTTVECPPCPEGQEPLSRNGCPSCTCAPVSECIVGACPEGLACEPGPVCVEGCQRLDCCSNVCVPPPLEAVPPEPAPEP